LLRSNTFLRRVTDEDIKFYDVDTWSSAAEGRVAHSGGKNVKFKYSDQISRQTDTQADRLKYIQANRQTNRQTDRQADR
jgi:hypothetical protein